MSAHVCPPGHTHGETLTCYSAHHCRCDGCKAGHARYRRRYRRSSARTVDSMPTIRRVQALAVLGWSAPRVGAMAGVAKLPESLRRPTVSVSTANRVAVIYDRLKYREAPARSRHERVSVTRTKQRAALMGWASPLAWDDINDPNEHPHGVVA